MKPTPSRSIEGAFKHVIYSPKGEIEGVLIDAAGETVQIAIDRHDPVAAAVFEGVSAGQSLKLRAVPQAPSPKGRAEHPVYDFDALIAIDGSKPMPPKTRLGPAYLGKVVRFNFAKHGQANGVVLDSGDFIHTKPEGLAKLRLKIGDTVEADGDAQRLADDAGWAVEATVVNGKPVKAH